MKTLNLKNFDFALNNLKFSIFQYEFREKLDLIEKAEKFLESCTKFNFPSKDLIVSAVSLRKDFDEILSKNPSSQSSPLISDLCKQFDDIIEQFKKNEDQIKTTNPVLTTYNKRKKRPRILMLDEANIRDDAENTATDLLTKKKYYLNDKSEPHICPQDYELSAKAYGDNNQFFIELAVAGGNTFRLLAGKSYPKYYTVKLDEENFYRASSDINSLIEEDLFYGLPDKLDAIITGEKTARSDSPILIGVITHLVFCYFLGEGDYKNIGKIKDLDIERTVGFDPEFCFHDHFLSESADDIEKELRFITDESLYHGDPKIDRYDGFFAGIWRFDMFFDEDSGKENKFYTNIFYTNWRITEVFAALARIIEIPTDKYKKIISKEISSQFSSQIDYVNDKQMKRLNCFRDAAYQLKGFKEFYENYSKKESKVHIFWHAYWGELKKPIETASMDDPYKRFEPAYQKDENAEKFSQRLEKEEEKLNLSRTNPAISSKFYKPAPYEKKSKAEVALNNEDYLFLPKLIG